MSEIAFESSLREEVKANAGWLIALGVVQLIVGVFAIASPLVAGVAVQLLVGAAILIAGGCQIVQAFKAHSWGRGLLGFLGGILAVAVGLLMLFRPLLGLASLTLFLAAYFLADGIWRTIVAFQLRPEKGWGWSLFGGLVSVLLGILIWRQWPLSGAWAIGTLFGIHMVFVGWSTIAVGQTARGAAASDPRPAEA